MTQIPPSPSNPPAEPDRPMFTGAALLVSGAVLLIITVCVPVEYASWWSCLTLPLAMGTWGWGAVKVWRELLRRGQN